MHLKSKYEGPTTLDFAGDDDIWVFVNGRLVIDLGGIHSELVDTVNLGALHVPFVGCELRAADNHGAVKGLAFAGHDFSTVNEDLVITYYDPAGSTYAMPNILGRTTYATQTITFTTNIQTVGDAVTAINAQLTAVRMHLKQPPTRSRACTAAHPMLRCMRRAYASDAWWRPMMAAGSRSSRQPRALTVQPLLTTTGQPLKKTALPSTQG